jgi:5-methylcytosine-specific restriction protein A
MSGFYLSLNQGWTFFENTYKRKLGKEKIKIVSQAWRNKLSSYGEDFGLSTIELKCKGDLGKGYELGHICGKFYSINDLPDDLALVNDLRSMIGVYSELKGHIGKIDVDKYTQLLASESNIIPLIEQEEEDEFNNQVSKAPPSSTPEEPQNKPGSFHSGGRSNWVRNPEKAAEALSLAAYRCEVDPTHGTFISASSGNNFVEAHHLIPMRLQTNFTYSIDVPGNIVSLCPNCHRAIHHAVKDVRTLLVTKLFERRRDKLEKFGISMTLKDLIRQY